MATATAEEVAAILPASHYITALRGRSFEERGMVVRYQVRLQRTQVLGRMC